MKSSRQPNLLFILSDQQRYDTIGLRKPGWLRTPHFDELVRGGTHFDQAYCSAQACVPSRACLLTGRHAALHRTLENQDLLSPREQTWPMALREAGYLCAAVGRTHHIDRGFDTVRVPYGDSYPMIDYGRVHEIPYGPDGVIECSPASLESFYEMRVAETAARLMEDLGRNRPFALYVGFILPHPPFVIPEPYFSMYDPATMPWTPPSAPEPYYERLHRSIYAPEFDEARERKAMAVYYGMVSLLDACLGRLLERLRELGLENETLVVATSDHGEQLGHRGLWSKGMGYDPSIRVPLAMRWPGRVPSGQICEAMVGNVDLGPTILDALGIEPMSHRSGHSFWPLVEQPGPADASWIYSALEGGHGCVYRDQDWKLIEHSVEGNEPCLELYDMVNDPEEQRNLAAVVEHAPRVRLLRDRLWQFHRRELVASVSVDYPECVQEPTFNAQFRRREASS